MSSKAAKRRLAFAKRERKRKIEAELAKDWKCWNCGADVLAISPRCLCSAFRPEPNP